MNFMTRLLRRPDRPDTTMDAPARPASPPRLPLPQRPRHGLDSNRARLALESGDDNSNQFALREIFTPTRPQRSARRLAGRQSELLRIFRAIALDRAHVVLYGERGRGKTSLVNLVASAARSSGYMVGRYTCSFDSQFDDIVRGLVRDLPTSMLATTVQNAEGLEGCEAALPRERVQPRDIVSLPGRLTGRHMVLIADEFDRVQDPATRTWFADTIKQASDRGASLSFVIVGVSDSLEELLGRHPSIQRNILGVALPLLTDQEILDILVQGGRDAKLVFQPEVSRAIVTVARGVPYVAQLLGLHAGTETLLRNSQAVETPDLKAAFQRAIDEIDPRVAALYNGVTDGEHDRVMLEGLRTIATSEQDRYARFGASARTGTFLVGQRPVDPAVWQRLLESGMIRPCLSIGPDTFAFAEPMMQHYIMMRDLLEKRVPA